MRARRYHEARVNEEMGKFKPRKYSLRFPSHGFDAIITDQGSLELYWGPGIHSDDDVVVESNEIGVEGKGRRLGQGGLLFGSAIVKASLRLQNKRQEMVT